MWDSPRNFAMKSCQLSDDWKRSVADAISLPNLSFPNLYFFLVAPLDSCRLALGAFSHTAISLSAPAACDSSSAEASFVLRSAVVLARTRATPASCPHGGERKAVVGRGDTKV